MHLGPHLSVGTAVGVFRPSFHVEHASGGSIRPMYCPVPRSEFLEILNHIRELHSARANPSAEDRLRYAHQKSLIAQVRSDESATIKHPTLRTMYKVADAFCLDDVGVHRLYGYRLERYFSYDRAFNGDRTHFVDPHLLPTDLKLLLIPEVLASATFFSERTSLGQLVQQWNTQATFRRLESWRSSRVAYLAIGLEDSAAWPEAAGAVAQVELLQDGETEALNSETIYVVQFRNGYRCCRCEQHGGRLILQVDSGGYAGPLEFAYPGEARIVGRITALFLSTRRPIGTPTDIPSSGDGADLVLSWERLGIADLFHAKYRRFVAASSNRALLRAKFEGMFGDDFSETTERRFREPVAWQPHGHTAIYLSLFHYARFRDTLRAFQVQRTHQRSYSLQEWKQAKHVSDLDDLDVPMALPTPSESWNQLNQMYAEYPGLVLPQIFRGIMNTARIWRYAEEIRLKKRGLVVKKGAWVLTSQVMKNRVEKQRTEGVVIPLTVSSTNHLPEHTQADF